MIGWGRSGITSGSRDLNVHATRHHNVALEFGTRQFARGRHPDRARIPFSTCLRPVDTAEDGRFQRSAVPMAVVSNSGQPPLVRLRPVLRLAGRLPDVSHVSAVGPVRVAEPCAQTKLEICTRSLAQAWRSLRIWHHRAGSGGDLSGVSRIGDKPERARLYRPLFGAAVCAQRTTLVPVATPRAEHHSGRH